MKIAFYAPMKPLSDPTPSGDQMIARDLHDYMVSKGHEVTILSEFRSRWFYQSPKRSAQCIASALAAAVRALRKKPDLFFTYHTYYKAPDAIAPALSRLFGRPYVAYEGVYSRSPSQRRDTRIGYHLNRFALETAKQIFTNMTGDIEGLKKLLPDERVTYVPPSIDTYLFSPSADRRAEFRARHGIGPNEVVVSSVAMLRPDRKTEGVEFAIRALGALKKKGIPFRFVHAGGGDCLEKTRALASELLGDSALLLGTQPRTEVLKLLQAADLFAFPGIDEGFGLVYIEAQSCGLPAVALDNGGVADAIAHERTGYLTPFMDQAAYQDALEKLIVDSEHRARFSRNAREYVLGRHDRETNYGMILSRCEELRGSYGNA